MTQATLWVRRLLHSMLLALVVLSLRFGLPDVALRTTWWDRGPPRLRVALIAGRATTCSLLRSTVRLFQDTCDVVFRLTLTHLHIRVRLRRGVLGERRLLSDQASDKVLIQPLMSGDLIAWWIGDGVHLRVEKDGGHCGDGRTAFLGVWVEGGGEELLDGLELDSDAFGVKHVVRVDLAVSVRLWKMI